MNNKIAKYLLALVASFLLTACSNDAVKFKEDYESLNGKTLSNGKAHRIVEIDKNNPFVMSNAKEIIEKVENKESFYVYFGSKICPWCRSVIENAVKIANYNGIDKVYYVDIWDDEANEILRDKYTLDDSGNSVLVEEGTEEYFKLLEIFNDVLPDYTYAANKNGGNKLDIAEKRIYIPLFVYVAKGKPIRATSGISELQTSYSDELTEEILSDQKKLFDNFFINICDESC